MTLLGMPFEKAAYSFGWGNLYDFAQNLSQESATFRALHPEESQFAQRMNIAAIMANLFDAVMMFSHVYAKAHGYKGKAPDPYPRPWANKGQSFGSDPIPISEFDKWYYGGD